MDHHIVSADGDSLIEIVEIIIVISITHRQTADDKGRKLLAVSTPLLLRIALYQFFINFPAYQTDSLLLQVLRLSLDFFFLFLNDRLRLGRSGNVPHLAEGVHIKGHIIHLALIICHRTVGIPVKLCQGIDKLPHLFIACMENVGSILMYMDILHILAVNISPYVIPFFQNQTGFPLFFCIPGKYACIKTASYQNIIVFFHMIAAPFPIRDRTIDPIPALYQLSSWLSRSYARGIPRKYHLIKKSTKR